MVDINAILEDFQARAQEAASSVDVDGHVESAKETARKVRERLETDERARNLTIGGGVLLAGLLATKGGRRMVGTVAKTGAVAALGALAYRAWQNRDGGAPASEAADAAEAGFVADADAEPAFSRAIVHTMAVAAYADGVIDAEERAAIDGAATTSDEDLQALIDGSRTREDSLDLIALAARTPNHAAQLYAAAVVATGAQAAAESAFLQQLASRLGIADTHARALEREVAD